MTGSWAAGYERQRLVSSGLAFVGAAVGAFLVGYGEPAIGAIVAGSTLLVAFGLPHVTDGIGLDERDRTVRAAAAKRTIDLVSVLGLLALVVGGLLVELGYIPIIREAVVVLVTIGCVWVLTGLFEGYQYAKRT